MGHKLRRLRALASFLVISALAACHPAAVHPPVMAAGTGVVGAGSTAALAQADKTAAAFTSADVEFMSGMIPHHAQAIVMSRMCPTHGARADIKLFCEKIIVAQTDEIRSMRKWLADRGQVVPDSMSTRHMMQMGGQTMAMLMPGMLSDSQMTALDQARGSAFDRLFLTGMIGHHMGAINMVNELFNSPNSGQGDIIFRFASDVVADQAAEIQRMQTMLETVP